MLRKKNKPSGRRFLLSLLLVAMIIACRLKTVPGGQYLPEADSSKYGKPLSSLMAVPESTAPPFSDGLYSPQAMLLRLSDRKVLMQKNSDAAVYPASLTKMMTAIVVIENLPNLEEKVTLAAAMFPKLRDAGATLAGFLPGEEVRAIDLLYGAMLPSGAECSIGLAEHIAGSERNFVRMMNQKAAELGMENTNFVNSTGLHAANHYTTVKDMTVLLSYALQNDTFRAVFTSARYSTQATNKHPDGITFYSTLFEKIKDPSFAGGRIIGGKTGYTEEAGLCLASLAQKGGQEYLLVTAGAKGNHKSEQYNITDAFAVYNSLGNE